jgi:hypothetical protein
MVATLEILKAARELISGSNQWTQRANAREMHGEIIATTQPEAVRWCAYGALNKVSRGDSAVIRRAYNELMGDAEMSLEGLNDIAGHVAVLARFDAAITRLEGLGT